MPGDGRCASRGPDTEELTRRWSALHHGIEPADLPLLAGYLRIVWAGGRVLARARIRPTAITVAGVAVAAGSVLLAAERPVTAGVAVVTAALCDSLDGATAVASGRATRSGAVADAIADRVADAAFAAVLQRRGVPARGAVAAAGLAWGVDGLRRMRRTPAQVTVAERPTFTVCAALACGSAAVTRDPLPARIAAATWIGAGLVGIGQLLSTPVGG